MQTIADILARTLAEAGIDTVFGLPGGEVVVVLEALRRHDIRFVLVHNESSALFMADATARLTGKPGVCLTTLGPGASNAVAGVAHAYLDRSPVLIITAQVPDRLHGRHTHQLVDLHALYAPITKGSFKLQPRGAAETVRAALDLAMHARPGPVHLQISNEDATQTSLDGSPPEGSLPILREPDTALGRIEHLTAARQLLTRARRPVIVAGLGLEPERPYPALRALAEAANAPLITTPKSKGALPADHPLAADTIGLTRTDPIYEVLDEADCIVAVGFDVVELVKPWDQAAPLIWIAPWPNEDPTIPAEVSFVGPMELVLHQLADFPFNPVADWGENRLATYRRKLAQGVLPSPEPGRLLPQAVMRAVRDNIPRDTLVTVDVGSHKILGSLTWLAYAPNRFLVSNGLSCMGFALPATIAASLALLKQPVVCFTGDAGLAMVMGELGLLARLQTPVIVVVFNDAALDLIRSHQVRTGHPVYGTEFISPDFVRLARAYGLDAYRVTTEAACAEAVQAAVASGRPTLIEAMIDPVSYPTTPKQRN